MPKTSTFQLQSALGQYCKTGENPPHSSIDQHITHYHRLVQNVMADALERPFPITIQWIGRENWQLAVQYFIENHNCTEPQIWKLPFEFLQYYQQHPFPFDAEKFQALTELMHFEWLEVEVFMMDDEPIPSFQAEGNINAAIFVPNPEIRILGMAYPFHLKAPELMTDADKGAHFVTVHRNINTKKVHFNDLSYPFVEMLLATHEKDCRFDDLQHLLLKYETQMDLNAERVLKFINFALEQQLILGFRNN